MKLEKLLKNECLYYVAVVLMAVNVIGYITAGSMSCVLLFGVAAYLSHAVTKNNTVDIFVGLFIANMAFGCGRIKEGFENESTDHTMKKAAAQAHDDARKKVAKAHTTKDHKDKKKAKKAIAKAVDLDKVAKHHTK